MKNFQRKLLISLLGLTFSAFLILPCCQIVSAYIAPNNHSCCSSNASPTHSPIHCSKQNNIWAVKSIENFKLSVSHLYSGYNNFFTNLQNAFSPQVTAFCTFTDLHRDKQNSIPLYLLHSILRI